MADVRRVIIDTDPGIDDTMAIILALASPELRVEGLTIVRGNVGVEQCARNALTILEIAGHADIPVAVGADRPLVDRKSTRLNSSHANISYAVFCLKKKK